jgi:transcriptional regulator with XRE-family HTH domain
MLDAPELAKRLCAAMDYRDPPMKSVELTEKMGVSKQVVYEWRTTGRISKGRLLALAEATGMPLEYYLEPTRGSSITTKAIWRKFGKAFAKVASLVALTLAFLLPSPAEASVFNNNLTVLLSEYTLRAKRLFILLFRNTMLS